MMNVMRRAWEIYRTLEGDRIAKLSQALKEAWAEAKAEKKEEKVVSIPAMIEKLVEMGASRWTNYGKDRLYLRKCGDEIVGLELDYYKSGRISSTYLNGEKVSNHEACKIGYAYSNAYIDLKTMTLCGSNSSFTGLLLEKLQAYLPVKMA